jgi:hypothetical protein
MAKDKQKSYKESEGLIRGFGDPKNAGMDSAHFMNLRDSAEAGFLKQQWDTKQPLQENKKLDPEAQH